MDCKRRLDIFMRVRNMAPMPPLLSLILLGVGSYLLGSIPFGLLAGRLRGVDLREHGSGNIGATNALRVLGKRVGYTVFALDFLKGALPVLVAWQWVAPTVAGAGTGWPASLAGVVAGIFSIVGHNFPVWLRFRGGKGIATSGGVILTLFPWWVFVGALGAWVVVFLVSRYVSLASLAGALALPVGVAFAVWLGKADGLQLGTSVAMWLLATYRHRSNIQRLLSGTEKRFERRKSEPGTGKP